jgi:hypothetical protein
MVYSWADLIMKHQPNVVNVPGNGIGKKPQLKFKMTYQMPDCIPSGKLT